MQFGIYTELQCDPSHESHEQVYAEAMEQIANADRLGYDYYATIEHAFFERFGISPNPMAFFAAVAQRTTRIRFRTLIHVLPMWNPAFLACQIAQMDHLTNGRYGFGVGRGHAWLWQKAGVPLEETRGRYEEGLEILLGLLEHPDGFSYEGRYWTIADARLVPRPKTRRFDVLTGGTSRRSYEVAGERGFVMGVPSLLPFAPLKPSVDVYREACARSGHTPRLHWGHAIYIDEDVDTARREAERALLAFLDNNAAPTAELPPGDRLERAGYGFYASGSLQELAAKSFDELMEEDLVWVGDPDFVIEKIEAAQDEIGDDLAEFTITVNPGGMEHWKAIKAQELFARRVIPHFRQRAAAKAADRELEPAGAE
jgi:alkanesulfonate monooxygenase SsuD/methylene tetrahydromethanopterin reductase-like flavin-dependent oxidoreductase (luciferase family)